MTGSVTFTDESRERSVRRKAEYDDSNPHDLVLTVAKREGGQITIPLLKSARSNIEQKEHQENTLLRVKPLAEIESALPVSTGHGAPVYQGKAVAMLRPGYLYIYRQDKLWRELEVGPDSKVSDVDLAAARKALESSHSDIGVERKAEGEWLDDVLVPVFLQGQAVMHDIRMAYSEVQWDWKYVQKLETDKKARNARTTGVGHAWAVTTVNDLSFQKGFPASRVEDLPELRARDLGVELMLESPRDFTPAFETPADSELCSKLSARLRDAQEEDEEPVELDIRCDSGKDQLAELRGQKGLACVALPDPLFKLRHSLAQLQLALHYLDAVDVGLKDKPLAHSAMLIRQAVLDPTQKGGQSSLAKYAKAIDRTKLDKVLDTADKDHAIAVIKRHVVQLQGLMSGQELSSTWEDYRNRNDLAVSEAYLLIADKLNVLQQIPGVLKAQGIVEDGQLLMALKRWVLDGDFLTDWAPEQPTQFDRLQRLVQDQTNIDEELLNKLNLQSLIYLEKELKEGPGEESDVAEKISDGVKVGKLVSGALDEWSTAVLTVGKRFVEEGSVQQIELQRIMQAASSNFVLTDPSLEGIEVRERSGARSNGSILGVHGSGLNRGLTEFDRSEGILTRAKDYLIADLIDDSGELVGSTSPSRAANALEETLNKTAGGTMVFFTPAGHPGAHKLSLTKVDFAQRVGKVLDGPAVSRGLVVLAAFNVFLEINNTLQAIQRAEGNLSLAASKTLGAVGDLSAASLKLSQVLGEQAGKTSRVYRLATRPLFDAKNVWLIGRRLQTAGAQTLVRTVGLASFVAAGVGTGLSFWEWRISLANKDFDAASGHAIAMTGGLIFMVNPLLAGVLAVPGWGWAVLGMGMIVGGGLYAGSMTDDPFEKLLKLGPFGTYPDESSGSIGEKAYYSQLMSLLTPVQVTAQKYADIDPDSELTHAGEQPAPDDYVITLRTPLISRLKVTGEPRSESLPSPFSLVVEEIAYLSSSMTATAVGKVETDQVLSTTLLRKITARQSLPQQSAVRFLVRREIAESSYSRFGYSQSVTTCVRVGLQAVVDTELGPMVFPAPVHENYEAFDKDRHGTPPSKNKAVINPYSQPRSPYWFFTEVFV